MLGNKLDANNTIILYIKKLTKQLHKTASTIGFIKKILLNNFIPTFIIMVLIFSYKSP